MFFLDFITSALQIFVVAMVALLIFDTIYDAIYARRQHRKNKEA